ncbi:MULTISPECIES: penicillin-binding transpeptidase domain-containing protein [Streptomyces]|uniref:penicillin-binding transpeptidase domain-containing protein n=1 Tax=Streptomyces scabiei TaxID=1930 RepID=UPI0004E71757|nr:MULTISPECIES: penicillin-binding transpeptidase domain-containing protein [Streptomyces]MBP5871518.1 penicillin-binding protein [Streptomyces sp. LBUM 1485]KFG06357.1 penicillin-binding protein [Streptomyces scabiei]MBP5879966.1 penicillin-binding protein [Streptomyces sp. LBUM 1477]MBP5887795.1 penicillin-binding protein [Streptomyces sp. LBUM 1487]MBP5889627.1 penicillin-binding protein [Streptomyces sp. LBUM 1481]
MHSMIRGALGVSGVLAALAALSTGCSRGGSPTDSADDKPSGTPGSQSASRPSSHRGLGDILVGGRAVTGSKPSGNKKVPYQRTYSDGSVYAPVTGYRTMVYGNAGLEAVYDDVLAPDPSGDAPGDVSTTIDPGAQKAAFDALGDRQGAAVALDAESGKILALVSTPSYDPAAFGGQRPADAKAWKTLNAADPSPLRNQALHRIGSPGTTFSVVVAAAALEAGLYETVDESTSSPLTYVLPRTVTRVTGASPRCEDASIKEALRSSCDNVFVRMAAELGADRLRATAEKFGFDDDTLTVPVKASESSYPQGDVPAPDTALTGIGGGDVRATPLQMARVAAVVAGEGRLVAPQMVERVVKADGTTVKPEAPGGRAGQAVSRRTADALRTALGGGTGAGSGGTSAWVDDGQKGSGTSWFITYADAEGGRPVAVAVCVEGSPSGKDDRAAEVADVLIAELS